MRHLRKHSQSDFRHLLFLGKGNKVGSEKVVILDDQVCWVPLFDKLHVDNIMEMCRKVENRTVLATSFPKQSGPRDYGGIIILCPPIAIQHENRKYAHL